MFFKQEYWLYLKFTEQAERNNPNTITAEVRILIAFLSYGLSVCRRANLIQFRDFNLPDFW
jgi:hypothetical protein